MSPTLVERVLDRDRLIVFAGLLAATLLAWTWIVRMGLDMYGPMTGSSAWMMSPADSLGFRSMLFAMWAVMMVGMMLPSAAPTILLYTAIAKRSDHTGAAVKSYAFASGYLVMWTAFAAAAVVVQQRLTQALVLTPMMELSSARASSAVFALAALYQFSPLKRACLSSCQSPATFLSTYWRNGVGGAFRMGMRHGLYCLGCCWALMVLLFAGGVMHVTTIALITLLVLVEKLVPWGSRLTWYTWATGSLLLILAIVQL